MTVLVAGTESAAGRAAYRHGIEEARRRGEDLAYFVLDGEHEPSPDLGDVVERVVRPPEHSQAPVGDLLDHVESSSDVSVITIGVRRRSAVAKLILGSTAQQIILEANVPVICVKA